MNFRFNSHKFYILTILLMCIGIAFGETSISSSVDRSEITIGDQVTYTVAIDYPIDSYIVTPPIAANLGMFEIQDFDVFDETTETENKQIISYTVSTFTTGKYTIPPIVIGVFHPDSTVDTLLTQAIEIEIKSLLEGKNPDELDIRGIKAPLHYPADYTWVWWLCGGLLVLLLAVLGLLLYLKKRNQGIGLFDFTAPPKPAHEIAIEKLISLEYSKYITFEEAKAYFTDLSESLREYIENGLHVPSLELTTFETLEGLKSKNLERKIVEEILTEADMVKFAKRNPKESRGNELRQKAIIFVKNTMPIIKHTVLENDDQNDDQEAPRKHIVDNTQTTNNTLIPDAEEKGGE